jgi:hypothetical protein
LHENNNKIAKEKRRKFSFVRSPTISEAEENSGVVGMKKERKHPRKSLIDEGRSPSWM